MRTVRALATTLALVMVLPGIGKAQAEKPFKDAWFWGLKGGGFAYGDASGTNAVYKQAPAIGIDWLITRTHGGLYVSASQAFLSAHQRLLMTQTDTVGIDLKDMRRFDAAAMIFPGDNAFARPYAGIGFTLKQIATAEPVSTTDAQGHDARATQSAIQSLRVGFAPMMIVGSQFRLTFVSAFFQATISPAQKTMFLGQEKTAQIGYEVGLRYNIGSSIEREP